MTIIKCGYVAVARKKSSCLNRRGQKFRAHILFKRGWGDCPCNIPTGMVLALTFRSAGRALPMVLQEKEEAALTKIPDPESWRLASTKLGREGRELPPMLVVG